MTSPTSTPNEGRPSVTSTDDTPRMNGPLSGLRVVELVGQGPGPYGSMLLADLGCDVVAVDRAAGTDTDKPATNPMARGKRSVVLDLKDPADLSTLLELVDHADVLIDPFRPGVCERLGIGPDVVMARNPRLIFGRMTGWGQDGPWAQAAGHDIDYIALSGALHAIGYEGQPPTMPINLLGDFAGGGLVLAMGVACAAFERSQSGLGQVIDVAMVDGAAMIFGPFFSAVAGGGWGPRGTNHLDGAAPFYGVYETSDGGWMAVGAIEPQFHRALREGLGLVDDGSQWQRATWPATKLQYAELFRARTRREWEDTFEGTEACVAPVLDPTEVATHPHTAARETVITRNGVLQPNTAPRFSRTPGTVGDPVHAGTNSAADVLSGWR